MDHHRRRDRPPPIFAPKFPSTVHIDQSPPDAGEDDAPKLAAQAYPNTSRPLLTARAAYRAVPYDSYYKEVFCFTTNQTYENPNAYGTVREFMDTLCKHRDTGLKSGILQFPKAEIPQGTWSMAFAPAILVTGAWVLIFAAPEDSETLWYFWPEKGGTEDKMLEHLKQMTDQGKIDAEEPMKPWDQRHKEFYLMVEKVVEAQGRLLETDWRAATFKKASQGQGVGLGSG